jgi:hypothetical protein
LRAEGDVIAKRLARIGAEIKIVRNSDIDRLQILTRDRQELSKARKAD